ncbi:sodium channel modifier 1-like [Macrosteles quadrilineatus]|uniref:sodium channel modifier 1-like n=1 Tax=Macrosteles quadrilineatus TaxID=74068 RepID=UPI0023E11A18|nr:sodium channel modifier 1-like [Macrosteles quadrilineatus]
MSFKRDGDDKSLLKNLNDERVRELLGNHVPQDEAKLLSNGRLTCLICIHRPIFDTISMLANHRRGKRHLFELSKHIKCKEEAERKVILEKEKKSLLGCKRVEAKHVGLLKYQRKQILDIGKASRTKLSVRSGLNDTDNQVSTSVKHYLKKMTRKTSLEKVVERNRENYGIDLQKNSHESCLQERLTDSKPVTTQSAESTALRSEIQEYETKLRMSGWIKDATGKWIKDPNVEFDSDEDDIPPPPIYAVLINNN